MSESKICKTCGLEKPISAFSPQILAHGGFRNTCKICQRVYHHNNRDIMPSRTPEAKRGYYHKDVAASRAYAREYYQLHRIKCLARRAVQSALDKGELTRPLNCSICGGNSHPNRVIEPHHYLGYEREHWLDVQWCCYLCHNEIHRTQRLQEQLDRERRELESTVVQPVEVEQFPQGSRRPVLRPGR